MLVLFLLFTGTAELEVPTTNPPEPIITTTPEIITGKLRGGPFDTWGAMVFPS